jgi:hypothetical protein
MGYFREKRRTRVEDKMDVYNVFLGEGTWMSSLFKVFK